MWDLGLVSDLGVWLPGKCGEGMGVLGLVFVFGFGNGCLIVVLLRFKMHIPFLLATKRSVEGVDCEAIS